MALLTYWSDPMWRVMRISTFVTSGVTLVILMIFLLASSSWRDELVGVVVINLAAFAALVSRTIILRSADGQSPSAE
jgi:hypothetical protein